MRQAFAQGLGYSRGISSALGTLASRPVFGPPGALGTQNHLGRGLSDPFTHERIGLLLLGLLRGGFLRGLLGAHGNLRAIKKPAPFPKQAWGFMNFGRRTPESMES